MTSKGIIPWEGRVPQGPVLQVGLVELVLPRFEVNFAVFGRIMDIDSVDQLIEVVYEDAELLVVNKPAGLVCHPTKTDAYSSLISRVRLYLGEGSRPHLINRLDRETSGVTIVAKDGLTARRLGKLW